MGFRKGTESEVVMMSELLERMKDAFIQCPDCEGVYGDEQYTCATCLCEGGQGTLTCREVLDEHVTDLTARLAAAEAAIAYALEHSHEDNYLMVLHWDAHEKLKAVARGGEGE